MNAPAATGKKQPVLITGASGGVGRSLLKELAIWDQERYSFHCGGLESFPEREPSKDGLFFPTSIDLREPISLRLAPEVVIHLGEEPTSAERMHAAHVEGTRRLLEWSAARGVRRFVLLSTVDCYGAPNNGGVLREGAEHRPNNGHAASKSACESQVQKFCEKSGMEYCILQLSTVFGRGSERHGLIERLIAAAQTHEFRLIGEGDGMINCIPMEDVVWAIQRAAFSRFRSGVYIVNDGCRVSAFLQAVEQGAGVRISPRRMPGLAARALSVAGSAKRVVGLVDERRGGGPVMHWVNSTTYAAAKFIQQADSPWPCGTLRAVRARASEMRFDSPLTRAKKDPE